MEDLQTILDRVLAGVGEMVAQRKAGALTPQSCAPGVGGTVSAVQSNAGGTGGQGLKSSADAFTADHSLPAQRVTGPKTVAGNKRREF